MKAPEHLRNPNSLEMVEEHFCEESFVDNATTRHQHFVGPVFESLDEVCG